MKKNSGFTLIELMIVVGLVAVFWFVSSSWWDSKQANQRKEAIIAEQKKRVEELAPVVSQTAEALPAPSSSVAAKSFLVDLSHQPSRTRYQEVVTDDDGRGTVVITYVGDLSGYIDNPEHMLLKLRGAQQRWQAANSTKELLGNPSVTSGNHSEYTVPVGLYISYKFKQP